MHVPQYRNTVWRFPLVISFIIYNLSWLYPPPPTHPLACDLCRLWRCYLSLIAYPQTVTMTIPYDTITQHQPHRDMNMTVFLSLYLLFSHTDCLIYLFIFTIVFCMFYNFVFFFILKNSVFFACETPTRYILATDPSNPALFEWMSWNADVNEQ